MSVRLVVAGTDTDVGKTVFAAALVHALDGYYWKPVQAGLTGETDSQIVARLSGLPASRILPEAYRLTTAASPHFAAERDDVQIDPLQLDPSVLPTPLVIEPAGGLAVPLTRRLLQINLLARWGLPVILCASTRLGTINHSLLSIAALKARQMPVLGVAFIGVGNADSEDIICDMGAVRNLGRLPLLPTLDGPRLRKAFDDNFSIDEIVGSGSGGR
jgi:dethiobiotin synthetase